MIEKNNNAFFNLLFFKRNVDKTNNITHNTGLIRKNNIFDRAKNIKYGLNK